MTQQQILELSAQAERGYLALLFLVGGGLLTTFYTWSTTRSILQTRRITFSQIRLPLLLLVGLVLRLPVLFQGLWYDETFTARMVSLPFQNLPDAILADVHPPLPYLLQWLTGRIIGSSEIALRLPALVFGVLGIYLVYRLAIALGLRKPLAECAALVVAAMPTAIYYSTEARQYALFTVLVLGAWISLLEDRRRWFVFCAALLPHVHNIGYVYLAVVVAVALYRHRGRYVMPVAAAGVIGATWLPFMLMQARDVSDGFWLHQLGIGGVAMTITHAAYSGIGPPVAAPVFVGVIAITMIATIHWRWYLRDGFTLLALVVGVPLLLALISWLWQPVFLMRALLPVGCGLAIVWVHTAAESRLLQTVLTSCAVLGIVGIYDTPRAMDYRAALATCSRADSVYYVDVPAAFIGTYHLPDMNYRLWLPANDLNQSLTPTGKAAFQFQLGYFGEIPGTVCVVASDNYLVSTEQRQHLAHILTYPHEDHSVVWSDIYTFHVYLVSIP